MIIMYHHIAPAHAIPASADSSEGWSLVHSPSSLAFHIEAFRRRGRRFVSLEEYVDSIESRGREPVGAVHLTFDDGWVDNYTYARPVLRALDVPATFFVTTDHIRGGVSDPRCMSVHQLGELIAAGMALGAHSRTHPDLTSLQVAELQSEIEGSKNDLETALGLRIDWFAYPGGVFNQAIVDRVRAAGFRGAVCSLGPARNDRASRYWLFRDILSEEMSGLRDRVVLWGPGRRLLEWRVRRRLREQMVS